MRHRRYGRRKHSRPMNHVRHRKHIRIKKYGSARGGIRL